MDVGVLKEGMDRASGAMVDIKVAMVDIKVAMGGLKDNLVDMVGLKVAMVGHMEAMTERKGHMVVRSQVNLQVMDGIKIISNRTGKASLLIGLVGLHMSMNLSL